MEILNKPFKQEEYDRYVAQATSRSPIEKERRTRRKVVYYPWKHEMGKSYFDNYPGMLLYHAHCIFSVSSLLFGLWLCFVLVLVFLM